MLAVNHTSRACLHLSNVRHFSKFNIFSSSSPSTPTDAVNSGLWELYSEKILPLERSYEFEKFYTPSLTEADFHAKPIVLTLGGYSTGKTTFIRHLLGNDDQPWMNIGPEPTTEKFQAIMYGQQERVIPGNAAIVDTKLPFYSLKTYGMQFLTRFEVAEVDSDILKTLSFVDSPGVLSGEKQRVSRGYDYPEVMRYFASRSDLILLLFDAYKLDISDELKEVIDALRGNDDKIRCILNKADQVNIQQLMRVYGSLLWSLGKVINTPETVRVYTGSFWDQPYVNQENSFLFDAEKNDIMKELTNLPKNASIRKINEFVKRARRVKVHSIICNHLRGQFGWFNKEKKQEELLQDLQNQFEFLARQYQLHPNDFPNASVFAKTLTNLQLEAWKFPVFKEQNLTDVDGILEENMPHLFNLVGRID